MLQLISSPIRKSSQSRVGSIIVILAGVFLLLTLNEGQSSPQQRIVDALFHTWFVMGAGTAAIWFAQRKRFGSLPWPLRVLARLLFALFLIFSMLDFFLWPPLWEALKPFGLARVDVLPIAVMGVFLVWGVGIAGLILRGTFRWFRRRYEHHGIAVGIGPLYLYFGRRRTS